MQGLRVHRTLLRAVAGILAALAPLFSGSLATAAPGIPPATVDPPAQFQLLPRYLVLMVLDGARPDYFGLTRLPHVDALRARGTQYNNAIAGILESETPSGHATISTGSTPRHNGILGFSWAENDKDFTLFSPTIVRAGTLERIMQAAHAPTIAELYKQQHPRAKVVALSAHKYYAADPLGGPKADAIMYFRVDSHNLFSPDAIPGHVPPPNVMTAPGLSAPANNHQLALGNHLATKLALSAFGIMHQHITLINYPDFDWPLGHVDGGNRAKAIAMMRTFDSDLGAIEDAFSKAGILDQTLFVITADHGMMPIHRFIPHTLFSAAIKAAGTSAVSSTYNTGAYFWLRDPGKAAAAAANIVRIRDPGVASVYYWSGGKNPGYVTAPGTSVTPGVDAANKYLLGTMLNGHQPNLVAFSRRGQTISSSKTYWKADHGGDSWPAQHVPLILAGPGVRQGFVTSAPAELIDVAPTVLTAMGVTPTGMEGSVLDDALALPQDARRADEIRRLTPMVQAMSRAN